MLQAIGAIVFLVLAYTVVALFAERLPVTWASGVALLVPLIGVAASTASSVYRLKYGRTDRPGAATPWTIAR